MSLTHHFLIYLGCGFALLCLSTCSNRLSPHGDVLVEPPVKSSSLPVGREVHVTYLGTNGYLIRSRRASIVVDPYFSRIDTRSILLNAPVHPDREAIDRATRKARFPSSVDAWLVTHAHFDHLFDVPVMSEKYGGKIVTSKTGAFLCEASGVSKGQVLTSNPGMTHHFPGIRVKVLSARHDKALGVTPYPGVIEMPLKDSPTRPRDWRMGKPLAFLIEIEGKRIYVESGGLKGSPPEVSDVDLAIVGTATPSSQTRYPEAVKALNPRFVMPSHQDNFFIPVEDGFQFSSLSNFPRIRKVHETKKLPGRMILMDYFATWKLP